MYTLFVSRDCGISYQKHGQSDDLNEFRPLMKEFDKNMLRWYLEKDGELFTDEICAIHKGIVATMQRLKPNVEN